MRRDFGLALLAHLLLAMVLVPLVNTSAPTAAVAPLMVSMISSPVPAPAKPVPRKPAQSSSPTQAKPVAPAPLLQASADIPSDTPKPSVSATATDTPVETAPTAPTAPKASSPSADLSTPLTEPRYEADYLQNAKPSYPSLSRRLREQGTVLLRVLVSAGGEPKQIQLLKSSGYPRLDDAALRAVEDWRFVPAKRGHEPLEAWVQIPLQFSLRS